jgi:hypothetical protein
MRSLLLALALLLSYPATARVEVGIGISVPGIDIGINMPAYPRLVRVPGYPVYYGPDIGLNFFFYDGLYWVFIDDDWYAASWYNGPWHRVERGYPDLVAKVLAIAAETEQGLTERSVADYMRSIGSFAEHFGANRPLRMKAVLEAFIQQTGPGYFQVELKRAWRRLLERAPHAA